MCSLILVTECNDVWQGLRRFDDACCVIFALLFAADVTYFTHTVIGSSAECVKEPFGRDCSPGLHSEIQMPMLKPAEEAQNGCTPSHLQLGSGVGSGSDRPPGWRTACRRDAQRRNSSRFRPLGKPPGFSGPEHGLPTPVGDVPF